MARDVKAQLRITPWPASPLPLPDVELRTWRLDDDEGVLVPCLGDESAGANAASPIPPPAALIKPSGETYLRLAEVDLRDPIAILEFVNRYGILGGGGAFGSLREYLDSELFWKFFENELDSQHETDKRFFALEEELLGSGHPRVQRLRDDDSVWNAAVYRAVERDPPVIETLAEFRFAARCIRDLYSAWLMFKDNREVHEFTWTSPTWPELFDTTAEPGALLSYMLKVFLRPFAPQVRLSWTYSGGRPQFDDLLRPADTMAVEPAPGPETVALYAACALELFNHIIDNAAYHECANERCKRTFVHQQGRSEKGQRRSRGVMYCSPACARATAQREYRRRRRRQDK